MKRLPIIIFLLLLIYLNLPQRAHADSFSVGIYPPLVHIQTSPGSDIQRPLVVKNYADNAVILNMQIQSFVASDKKDGEISLQDKAADTTFLQQQVRVFDQDRSVNQLLLSPKEVKNLALSITVPKAVPDRDYYFSILFVSNTTDLPKINASSIQGGIGMNVLLSILPQSEDPQGYIKSFSYPLFPKAGPVHFGIEIANQGKHAFQTSGSIVIKNILTGAVSHISLLPVYVLSDNSRFIPDRTSGSFTSTIWNSGTLFGIYKTDLSIKLNNEVSFHKTVFMYSFPLTIITAGLIFVLIFIMLYLRIRDKLL